MLISLSFTQTSKAKRELENPTGCLWCTCNMGLFEHEQEVIEECSISGLGARKDERQYEDHKLLVMNFYWFQMWERREGQWWLEPCRERQTHPLNCSSVSYYTDKKIFLSPWQCCMVFVLSVFSLSLVFDSLSCFSPKLFLPLSLFLLFDLGSVFLHQHFSSLFHFLLFLSILHFLDSCVFSHPVSPIPSHIYGGLTISIHRRQIPRSLLDCLDPRLTGASLHCGQCTQRFPAAFCRIVFEYQESTSRSQRRVQTHLRKKGPEGHWELSGSKAGCLCS